MNYQLLQYCAPTLANVKLGNLFTLQDTQDTLMTEIQEKQQTFQGKGVDICMLGSTGGGTLIYVYRPQQLRETLNREDIQKFLKSQGYQDCSLEGAIETLSKHIKQASKRGFPHEIGVFLGYPLEDIQSFMIHKGKNSFFTGCWKVYHNPEIAAKTFQKFKKCRKIYLEKYEQGFDMNRLTVAS